jgi:hypothetical protein
MNRRFFFDAVVATMLVAMFAAVTVPQIPKQGAENPESGKWYATKWGRSYRPSNGFLPDQKTAIQVAKVILIPVYGEDEVKNEEPFTASLKGNIWTVKGAVRSYPSGNAEVKLSKIDGAVLFLTHSQ